ncbi:MAG: carboxylating nicotinate-nucleotide diphosphorylase [Sediminibacterium sp. Gen4]|jgi:nicotinate-nucleotide pyrophosphorylase (carboxylating)|uniref:carboxylating nicotinate-nucleotide diphosphorylase n=1 Tax=unclassified Sediminibacterium TaxID=2635961 RepID=UPI0015C1B341|nr:MULTISPECIES: carboxylating nicotinate-nucleotide diphosphorylase [unclassified Sediminibacterium]MBW0162132.1 carboxylating nicotinate-nucleotide diphosphorylase [Sediminibacterium sp.]MBW0163594.1 carboxylating nicotinate-nucleotide diphosphorylase [Sediminibacterium sp.]NWK66481.1 carboxylating nicotinate-nucleotide diphosphorylase [Sediminibacterium sp. Gen4]
MSHFDEHLKILVTAALKEDIGEGDHSTLSCIPKEQKGKAVLKIKQNGILAGVEIAKKIFSMQDPDAVFTIHKSDGDAMQEGETAFEVTASIHTILSCERLVLNCMQRMSGIATLTRQYTERLKGYTTRLLDTRKTTPNFRLLEKEAVRIGGGVNHRFGLYDMIMLKDNHIDYAGGIIQAIDKAHDYVTQYHPHLKIEVETRTLSDVELVCAKATGKVFRIMLDNFTPSQVKEAVTLINGRFETEASGGITLQNIQAYATANVDYVSVGGLIHQAQSLDLSLKAVIVG